MKKLLLLFLTASLGIGLANAQVRYLDEVFTSADLTTNVQFASNYDFLLPGNPVLRPISTHVYQPHGDNETGRAAVIVLHTGDFLPRYLNQSPTGSISDSSVVEAATLFAKRGYVAFTPDYRLGWDPANQDPTVGADVRRGTLLNAVYRALNDVKALVRYIKKSVAEDGNPYGIDPDKIIIYGHGSGGYLSLAYGSLDRIEELQNEASGKWLATVDVPSVGFTQGQLYINPALVGGVDGFGGVYNDTNHYGYSNDVAACVNVGGALGDSAWMEPGEPPLVSFHCPDDGYAPFTQGLVIVPTTQEVVVDVVGSRWAIGRANDLGNNDPLYNGKVFNDPYTQAAEAAVASSHLSYADGTELLNLNPADYKGLFPFIRPQIQWPYQESSPWDWWDYQSGVSEATNLIAFIYNISSAEAQVQAEAIFNNAASGAPTMSATQGRTYLDSIMGYLAPRMRELLEQDVKVEEVGFLDNNTFVYPNPANDYLVVKTREGIKITDVEIFNMTGSLIRTENGLNKFSHQMNGIDNLTTGLYLVKVTTDQGIITKKVFVD